jgi:predicted Zn finger-like uncharacterized protein
MRIVCPSCAAEYDVPASRMTPLRKVRCARCGGEWVAVRETGDAPSGPDPARTPPQDEPGYAADPGAALPPVTAMDRLTAAATRPRPAATLIAAWIMTFIALAAAMGAVIAWRDPIIRIWPPSSRILGQTSSVTPAPARNTGKASEPSPAATE